MRRMLLAPALALCLSAQAAELAYGRLFYTQPQRAALEDARRRNIRAEELAAEAARQPMKVPGPREVTVSGIVQRSDGGSVAWINGKPVESQTKDGLRVRHGAGSNGVVVYDPEKRRSVAVKVGQQVDLNSGRIEESYQTRRAAAHAAAQQAAQDAAAAPVAGKDAAKAATERPLSADHAAASGAKPAAGDDGAQASEHTRAAPAGSGGEAASGDEPGVEYPKPGG